MLSMRIRNEMLPIPLNIKIIYLYFCSKVAYSERLYDVKITKTNGHKPSHLGNFNVLCHSIFLFAPLSPCPIFSDQRLPIFFFIFLRWLKGTVA